MAQVISTNIASLNAQRNLNKSQGMLATSLQRLSSGMRINSAKDDAAGLAISERFTAQIRGLNQAVRNSNDGISLAQTAEGALAEVTNNLQRIRELAVQSTNATNSSSDRVAMQAEVSQLVAEIDRVSQSQNLGPFVWGRKANARIINWSDEAGIVSVLGEHNGYSQLDDPVIHRRHLELDKTANSLSITDNFIAKTQHSVSIHFYLDIATHANQETTHSSLVRSN